MTRYATIDVGSNSVLLFIAEKDRQHQWHRILDQMAMPRLGEGVKTTGIIKKIAMERTLDVLFHFMQLIAQNQVDHIVAAGTMALRSAKNAREFIEMVKAKCQLDIEILSGEEEARLSFLSAKKSMRSLTKNLAIFDIGGGSTEFFLGSDHQIFKQMSLNIGAIQLTEQYFAQSPVPIDVLNVALQKINNELRDLQIEDPIDELVGVGGTVTTMAAVKHQLEAYDPLKVNGTRLDIVEVLRQLELYRSKSIAERKRIPGLEPARADIILAGCAITHVLLKKLKMNHFIISDFGLRHGLMIDRFGMSGI
ncbi:Ppx/GppA family phosphatase [candidate division KSB1 bacterium]|nr:Ppx/GppA family phosphatase [candidate division KSB1 bacterium]